MRNIRQRQVEHNLKIRKLVFLTFGVLFFIYLTLNLIVSENGLLRYIKLKYTRNHLLAEIKVIEKQNQDIKSQIESLEKNPDVIEELAREYGLTKKGELIFKFDDQE